MPRAIDVLLERGAVHASALPDRWHAVPASLDRAVAEDVELARAARDARVSLCAAVERRFGPFDARHLAALREVPRERFVLPADIAASHEDVPLALDPSGHASVSAPHAYLLTFRLLGLAPGDRLVELGTGTGYGAALAAHIVGPAGGVLTVEIDPVLAARARRLLELFPKITSREGDARTLELEPGSVHRLCVTFAVARIEEAWASSLSTGGRLVAPVGAEPDAQRLLLLSDQDGRRVVSDHGAVRYVAARSR